ncbi:ATP-binding protein [Hyalangium versicolor]|uniref:ATP-binding protein n=1 Tax=Hyalangium versicolor TaxID=2861190 RepID=UPI001CCCA3FF|nr:ATP-binding protein [Hyalangium versicolor]
MAFIKRKIDQRNLVRELANNKVDALELIREALSNARDHGASSVWIRTTRGAPPTLPLDVVILNDGEGMTEAQLEAFWGVSTSVKPPGGSAIGYKGHGTKLYFAARRLSVASRVQGAADWTLTTLDNPLESDSTQVEQIPLPAQHLLYKELEQVGLLSHKGVAVLVEGCQFPDAAARFMSRRAIETYCDWFTVIGDIRSGVFRSRSEFHDTVHNKKDLPRLRQHESPLIPLTVNLRVNGEDAYRPLGFGPIKPAADFMLAWKEDKERWAKESPGLAAFGHRFADHHEAERGAVRVRDDLTALCLTPVEHFMDDSPYALVIRVEGQRRQLNSYLEGSRQPVGGEYDFDERFGLWLCKDFVPIVQRNDLLQTALTRATEKVKKRLRFDLSRTRFWQVFVNHQALVLTANRNGMANVREHEEKIVSLVADRIAEALKEDAFREWIENLQAAVVHGRRSKEIEAMNDRVDAVTQWFKKSGSDVDPAQVKVLELLDEEASLRLPKPTNEQEVFLLYMVLTGRYRVPLRVIEYETRLGVDAIAQVVDTKLFDSPKANARVEFKLSMQGNRAVNHFFDAIDAFICWSVSSTGELPEAGDAPRSGTLRKRAKPLLDSGLDAYEVEYDDPKGQKRKLPVLVLDRLFASQKKATKKEK